MKKKITFTVAFFMLVIGIIVLFRPITLPKEEVIVTGEIIRVIYMDGNGVSSDITLTDEDAEVEQIKSILSDMKIRRTLEEKRTIHLDEIRMELDVMINHKSWIVLLGNEDCVYGPGIMSRYKILNAGEIQGRLEEVIEVYIK